MPVGSQICFRLSSLVQYQGKGILLIRNPFDAMISFFRHNIEGFHSRTEASKKDKKENIGVFYTQEFEAYAYSHIKKWRTIAEDWVTAGDVVVIHYEELRENKVAELEKMLNHLQIPLDRRRLSCVEYADLNVFKRKKSKLKHSPYSKGLSRIIWKNIGEVDRLLVRMGQRGIPYHMYESLRCFDNVTVSYGP